MGRTSNANQKQCDLGQITGSKGNDQQRKRQPEEEEKAFLCLIDDKVLTFQIHKEFQ